MIKSEEPEKLQKENAELKAKYVVYEVALREIMNGYMTTRISEICQKALGVPIAKEALEAQ